MFENNVRETGVVISAFFVSIALSAGVVLLLLRSPLANWSLDRTNHRSLHFRPTPRVGGIAILISVALVVALLSTGSLLNVALFSAAILSFISFVDDKYTLSVALRIAVHFAASILATVSWFHGNAAGGILSLVSCALFVAAIVVSIVWMTNLFNFMDGANGLAGGMTFFGFGCYAIAAALADSQGNMIAIASATISGAALGFLFFNFPVAKIFLGDAGSVPIGFLAIVLGIQGYVQGLWDWWFGLLVFSIFIVDATITLIKRLVRGEKIWLAHREHYYQRLILAGWSHRKTVTSYYFVMLASTISALAAQNSRFLYSIAAIWVITYASLIIYLERRFAQDKKRQDRK